MNAVEATNLGRTFRIPDPTAPWHRRLLGANKAVRGVEGVTLAIGAGERVALLGRNGSGKSTLQKLVAGVIAPTSGALRVLGEVPHHRSAAFLRRLGILFGQKSLLFADLTVHDALGLYRIVYGLNSEQYRASLKLLDTHLDFLRLAHRPVRKLSLGERMRCELVAALLHQPELLLLDEPAIGVDTETQAGLIALLQKPTFSGATLLLTTHDTDLARAVCSRIVVLDQGRVRDDLSADFVWRVGVWKRYQVSVRPDTSLDIPAGHIHSQTTDNITIDLPAGEDARLRELLARDPTVLGFNVSVTPLDTLLELARNHTTAKETTVAN